MKTKTKKAYEEYLNDLTVCYDASYVIGGKFRSSYYVSRKYGTALRKHDPIAFEVGFYEWSLE